MIQHAYTGVAPGADERSDSRGIVQHDSHFHVLPDVVSQTIVMVNVVFVGPTGRRDARGGWTLIDAGIPMSASRILGVAHELYGPNARPDAIVLTHGHFDHVGSLRELADLWDVPIYVHELEMPYLTGKSKYPPPDPTVGGGLFTRLSPMYPKGPYDFSDRLESLPADGTIPTLPGWRWIATPGHSPGHVSLFRDSDRTLIAGDAIVTQKQESLIGVLTAAPELRGPPMYFTPDWDNARESVRRLADLRPEILITGHGVPIRGIGLQQSLQLLAERFDELHRPKHGRYVHEPAITDAQGIVSLPPAVPDPVPKIVAGVALAAVLGIMLASKRSDDD